MRKVVVLFALLAVAVGGPEDLVRGVVLDPAGQPLAGARVTLRAPGGCCALVPGHSGRSTRTAPDGAFSFAEPHAPLEIYVEHPGLAPAWQPLATGTVVRLREPAYVTGRLDRPARVHAARGVWTFHALETEGEFRLGPLPPGVPLTVTVSSPGHRPRSERVVLEEGETRRVDLPLDPGLSLRGRVRPTSAGAVIRASQGEPRESRATCAEDGTFLVTGLVAGPVRLVVLAPGRAPTIVDGTAGVFLDVELDR